MTICAYSGILLLQLFVDHCDYLSDLVLFSKHNCPFFLPVLYEIKQTEKDALTSFGEVILENSALGADNKY